MAANFSNWTSAVEGRLVEAGARLPAELDRRALAEFIMTTMEGGIMQARTHRDVGYFDRNVAMLRDHVAMLTARARATA